jgi:hypothetical protein
LSFARPAPINRDRSAEAGLSNRQREVLRLAVRHYVDTMEPVGSKTLVLRFGLPDSPATVRSAMGVLSQRGLLTQPHTSAGRIPSQQGYRLYVNQLMPAPGAVALQLERELAGLSLQWAALDDLLSQPAPTGLGRQGVAGLGALGQPTAGKQQWPIALEPIARGTAPQRRAAAPGPGQPLPTATAER